MQTGDLLTDDKKTPQFSLLDLFAAMALLAILLAMFAPWIRWIRPEQRIRLLVSMGVQFFMLMGVASFAIYRRRAIVEQGGKRLGIAFFGTAKWSGWLPIRSMLLIVMLAAMQIFIAIGISSAFNLSTVANLMNSTQLAFVLAHLSVNFVWRVYPMTLEFFESGVVMNGQVIPWSSVEIRDSQFFSDRVGVLLKPQDASSAPSTRMALVSKELRQEIERRCQT